MAAGYDVADVDAFIARLEAASTDGRAPADDRRRDPRRGLPARSGSARGTRSRTSTRSSISPRRARRSPIGLVDPRRCRRAPGGFPASATTSALHHREASRGLRHGRGGRLRRPGDGDRERPPGRPTGHQPRDPESPVLSVRIREGYDVMEVDLFSRRPKAGSTAPEGSHLGEQARPARPAWRTSASGRCRARPGSRTGTRGAAGRGCSGSARPSGTSRTSSAAR